MQNSDLTEKRIKNLKPFVKGQSGNPKGRPEGSKSFRTLIKQFLETAEVDVKGEKKDGYYAVVAALYNKATKKGDIKAIREILDRIDGKTVQAIEQHNTGEQKLTVTVTSYADEK